MKVFGMITLFLAGAAALTSTEQQVFLDKHNQLRAMHDSPAMAWDGDVATFAQGHCDELKNEDKFEHSEDSGYGENLYKSWGKGRDVAAADSVQGWYDEIQDYNYANSGFSMATGHFTQVVWKKSVKLGCAISDKMDNGMSVVWVCCNYSPPGNYMGEFEDNVLPLQEDENEDENEDNNEDENEDNNEDDKAEARRQARIQARKDARIQARKDARKQARKERRQNKEA